MFSNILNLLNFLVECAILYVLVREYRYDEQKDLEKKQRRTKTTKKTTTHKDGTNITEESTEAIEPISSLEKESK